MNANANYTRPILSILFDVLACLVFIGAGIALVGALATDPMYRIPGIGAALGLVFAGVVYVGIGQVINSLGQSAHFAERNALRSEEQRQAMLMELSRQTTLLAKMLEEADETAGDRFTAAEEARKFHEKALTFLARADAQNEHTNALIKWLGESNNKNG